MISADFRTINFAQSRQQILTPTISYFGVLGKESSGPPNPTQPPAERPSASLYLSPTIHLTNRLVLRPGLVTLNLLDGDTTDGTGGSPRVDLTGFAGFNYQGMGINFSASYRGPTRVRSTDPAADLYFSSLTKIGIDAFVNLEAHIRSPWAQKVRIGLNVDNVMNNRIHVRDRTGNTPNSYQPDFLDPLGRVVAINLRKIF